MQRQWFPLVRGRSSWEERRGAAAKVGLAPRSLPSTLASHAPTGYTKALMMAFATRWLGLLLRYQHDNHPPSRYYERPSEVHVPRLAFHGDEKSFQIVSDQLNVRAARREK